MKAYGVSLPATSAARSPSCIGVGFFYERVAVLQPFQAMEQGRRFVVVPDAFRLP
jgi:hypothetical protein